MGINASHAFTELVTPRFTSEGIPKQSWGRQWNPTKAQAVLSIRLLAAVSANSYGEKALYYVKKAERSRNRWVRLIVIINIIKL